MLMTLDSCYARFQSENLEITAPEIKQQLNELELCSIIAEFDGVIAGDDPFNARVLETGSKGRLKVLAKWGIGVDAIDFDAAAKFGILCSNTPNVFGDEVADVAIGYAILLARQLHKIDSAVRQGHWLKIQGTSLYGKTAGIIGLGSIGQAIAKRCHTMGMSLLGFDINQTNQDFIDSVGLNQVSFETLLKSSDYLFVACALTQYNHHLLEDNAFSIMNPGISIINVARGALIKESALLNALDNEIVKCAALDVFENEPLAINHRLCQLEQVILGSHNASNTKEAVLRVNQMAIDNLVRDLMQCQ